MPQDCEKKLFNARKDNLKTMSSTKGRKRNASKSDMVKSSPKRLKLENIASIEGSLEHERKFSTKCNIMSFSDALTSLLERVISSEDLDSGIKDALKKEENVLQLMELIPAERLYKESSIVGALIFINWTDFGENTMNRFLEYLLGIMKCCNWRSSDFEHSPYQKMLFSICRNIYKPSSSLLMTSPEYQILRSKVAGRCKKILKEIFTETKGGDRILQSLSRMWSLPLFAIASIDGVEDYVKFSLSLYYVATEEQQKTIFGMYIQKLSEFEVAATPSTLTAEKITEFEQTRLELIDVLYKTLFKFLDKMCSCKRTKLVSSVSQPEELEKVFNTMLEPLCVAIPPRLEDTQFVQYIPMYFISLDAKYKEKLIGELQRRCSERVSKDKSNESCGYLFSVLGAYTEIKISMFVRHLRKVVKWLKNYSDQFPLKSVKGPTFSAHLNFYNVAQGFFQSIAIRQESFAGNFEARNALAEMKPTVDSIINGYLNPLRFVNKDVAESFVPAAIDLGIAQPSAKYEDVKREIIPVAGIAVEALPFKHSFETEFSFPRSSMFVNIPLFRPYRPKIDRRRPENISKFK